MVENLLHNQCLWVCLHTENLPAKVIQNPRIYVKVRETVQYAWLKKKNSSFMKPFTLEKGSIMPKCDAVLTLWQADEQNLLRDHRVCGPNPMAYRPLIFEFDLSHFRESKI